VTLVTTFKRTRRTTLFTFLAVLTLAAACGSDKNSSSSTNTTAKTTCATGSVAGAGSTFVQTIVQQWVKDYEGACPGATINYQGVGSGAGIAQLTAGTVDFAGSDVPMKPDEEAAAAAKNGAVVHIPWTSGAIAIMFNVSGVTSLKLTPATLAGIFAGTITKWNDPALATDNTNLPATPIQVVHRSDGSGTTKVFTSYLTANAPTVWKAGADKDVPWPTGTGAKGSDGVTAAVKQSNGAIGYAELSFAKGSSLPVASVKNGTGAFVGPTSAGVAAALADATVPADMKVQISANPTSADAYPISTISYVIVSKKPADAGKAALLKAFITYALTTGQKSAGSLFYAELPSALASQGVHAAASIGT